MAHETYTSFEEVKARLDEIVDAVNDDTLPLDDALALYEEAVGLGLRASDLLEENIEEHRSAEDGADGATATEDAPGDDAPTNAEPVELRTGEGEPVSA